MERLRILNVNFVNCNEIENLLNDLPALIKESDMRSIGIIVDASESFETRWSQFSIN